MKKIILLLLVSFLMTSAASAEIKTYEGFGEYVMSDFETPDIAKQRAKQRAEAAAQEQAGVFVKSNTKVVNYQLESEEIEVMTAGIMKVHSVEYDRKIDSSGLVFTAKVLVEIDTDEIDNWLKKNAAEKSELIEQNRALRNSVTEQEKQLAELKLKLAEAEKNNSINSQIIREEISEEFAQSNNFFLSNKFLEEGNNFYARQDYRGAIDAYTKSLNFNPSNVAAYVYRGSAFGSIQNYPNAEADYIQATRLDSQNINARIGLGLVYYYVHDYNSAISSLNYALQIDSKNGQAYYLRSLCFRNLNRPLDAMKDYGYAKFFGYSD